MFLRNSLFEPYRRLERIRATQHSEHGVQSQLGGFRLFSYSGLVGIPLWPAADAGTNLSQRKGKPLANKLVYDSCKFFVTGYCESALRELH
jgi:hypothetical protein